MIQYRINDPFNTRRVIETAHWPCSSSRLTEGPFNHIGGCELLIRPSKIDVEDNHHSRYLVNIWARIVK